MTRKSYSGHLTPQVTVLRQLDARERMFQSIATESSRRVGGRDDGLVGSRMNDDAGVDGGWA
jgi:hypothetical protein